LSEAAAAKTQQPAFAEMRAAVEDLIASIDIEQSAIKLGTTQVGSKRLSLFLR
jgi:hypothetical protein